MFYLNVKFLIMYIVIFYASENNETASNIRRVPFSKHSSAYSCLPCHSCVRMVRTDFHLYFAFLAISSCSGTTFFPLSFALVFALDLWLPAISSLFSTLMNFNNFIKFFFYVIDDGGVFIRAQIQLCGAFNIQI